MRRSAFASTTVRVRYALVGTTKKIEVLHANERGGLEVNHTTKFSTGDLRVLMYRPPNGIIELLFMSWD